MSIKVLYFGELKDLLGRAEDEIAFDKDNLLSPRELWAKLNPDIPFSDSTMTAINMDHISTFSQITRDNVEIAYLPPVGGG